MIKMGIYQIGLLGFLYQGGDCVLVFYIDKSIKDELSNREILESEMLFFSDMASAYQHGFCYLCGDITSLDYLSEHLGNPSNNIYNAVKSHYAENGIIIQAVSKVCILTFQKEYSMNILPDILQKENKSIFIPIQLAIAQNIKLNELCCLVGENLIDCKFYEMITKYYCYKNNMEKFNFKFHPESGGGNTTCEVFEKVVETDKFLSLCIVDSDRNYGSSKEYPGEPHNGDTLNRIQKKILSKLPPHEIYPLHVHEIENLIPFQILQRIKQEQLPDMEKGLNFLKELKNINKEEAILYYDFKNGFPYMKEKPKRAYWKNILLELGRDSLKIPPETGKQDNQNMTFPPLSKNKLLEKAIEILQKEDIQLHIDDYLFPHWNEIGILILTWCCTSLPVRT